jgi:XRE family aerobic/anaerobic benzoate catabolism transcriptional regulator
MSQDAPPPLLARIGARVRRRRHGLDLSIKALADRSGLSPRFLSDVESGTGNIAIGRLERIADALSIPLATLVQPTRPSGARAAIDALLDGRSEQELSRLRHTLEITLGRRQRQVIALLGIRGAGKSSVGPRLAAALSLPFVELDKRIEAAAGMSPANIFDFHGEPHYRQLERRCLAELIAADKPCVVAVPGGVVGNGEALALLRTACFSVWLRAKAEDYWTRVFEQGDTRPTAGRTNAMDDLRNMMKKRDPLYKQSDLIVQTSGRGVDEVVEVICTGLERKDFMQEQAITGKGNS